MHSATYRVIKETQCNLLPQKEHPLEYQYQQQRLELCMVNDNIQPNIDAFNQCKWNLTLIGNITVLQTFAVPKLIYPLTVIESPSEAILKKVETSMFKFFMEL